MVTANAVRCQLACQGYFLRIPLTVKILFRRFDRPGGLLLGTTLWTDFALAIEAVQPATVPSLPFARVRPSLRNPRRHSP